MKKFENPTIEVKEIQVEDVITTSTTPPSWDGPEV